MLERIQAEFSPEKSPDPAVVLAATIYLMSCHSSHPCPRLAKIVTRHLSALSTLDLPPTLRAMCRQLCPQWNGLAERLDTVTPFANTLPGSKQN